LANQFPSVYNSLQFAIGNNEEEEIIDVSLILSEINFI